MNLTCKEAHRLISESMDKELPAGERHRLKLHIALCEACSRFSGQMAFLRRAMHQFTTRDPTK
jgi:predicted anti-sigma-YlaC factor YlaD